MSDADRDRCLAELERHQNQICVLALALADIDRVLHHRHATFLSAQVIRHRISVALLQSRLASAPAAQGPTL